MTNLTDVNIKELLKKSNEDLRSELEAMLPKPTHPEHLFDLRATHPEHGEVLCIWDKPGSAGGVLVRWRDESDKVGSRGDIVPVAELTFPHQATKPEDVPVGEAWLVNVDNGKCSGERVVALKYAGNEWRTGIGAVNGTSWWEDGEVTLITPLVPARPEPEPEPEHPRTLSNVEDYENAPEGTVVAEPGWHAWIKDFNGRWRLGNSWCTSREIANTERQVLRKGWGNER